jgi:hypothetical protein
MIRAFPLSSSCGTYSASSFSTGRYLKPLYGIIEEIRVFANLLEFRLHEKETSWILARLFSSKSSLYEGKSWLVKKPCHGLFPLL